MTLLARAAKLAAAAWHGAVAEYRRQRHPERGWFYYARIGAGVADPFRGYTIGLPEGWVPPPPKAAGGDD